VVEHPDRIKTELGIAAAGVKGKKVVVAQLFNQSTLDFY